MTESTKSAEAVKGPLDLVGSIMAFEAGEMDQDEVIEFAQQLWDTGLWRQLQGSYGRFVHSMLEAGYIDRSGSPERRASHFGFKLV